MNTLEQENAKLKAEIEALKAKAMKSSTISFKVSEKGAVSVYGLGRFPITLYKSQWTRLLSIAAKLQGFINDNAALLKEKE